MKRIALAIPLALAGCHSSPTVTATNASVGEVANQVAAATGGDNQFVSPGHWEATMKLVRMEMPGMPPEMAARMKASMGAGKTFASCVTPEEAKRPKADFFGGQDKACRYDHFTMGGGRIDAALRCDHGGGQTQTMTMTGTYSPNAYHMAVATDAHGAGPMGAMTMKMEMDAKRTGQCSGKESR